ncbi:NmrA family NAD(P)-binding protein [Actinoallomurus iriomotensis]|uniref:Nucleoside-diphosphate sugar epimerase n=1 Tax=Actinoallomurus iriomotensis TaxID=478107 RepID=A0A9W6VQR1_9ACTN|nr:NmrA family NAD(P)-binding protein [Actinoallomurus iriomotensis]GLY74886.1 nucleoside-diphosphate sugar epimerase [Actinoallomurus iriomotensis]
MFFLAGITGHVGGAAARRLLDEGHPVRALVRDPRRAAEWARRGVDVREGDLGDAAAVAGALEGVDGAFLMLPPVLAPAAGFPEARALIVSFREALRKAPPPRLVVLSSVGSEREKGLGNITSTHLLEEAVDDVPFPTAFVRAGSFLENYTFGLDAAAATGWFDTFLTPAGRPVPMVATADIGAEVARLLTEDWNGRRIIELGSPVSPDDLARAMSDVLGRPVRARSIPRERWTAALAAQGLPPGATGPFEEMSDGFNSGWIDFGVPGAEPVAGRVTPAAFFEQAMRARDGHRPPAGAS